MIFYQPDHLPAVKWENGGAEYTFIKRQFSTENEALIKKLKEYGYPEVIENTDPTISPAGNTIVPMKEAIKKTIPAYVTDAGNVVEETCMFGSTRNENDLTD